MNVQQRLEEAEQFIRTCYSELGKSEQETELRLRDIRQAFAEYGRYEHTEEELQHGAKMAWRNSNRCIGRFFWDGLKVIDARHIDTVEGMAEALFQHIAFATNGGKIRPTITIFRPEEEAGQPVRIWNHQLIRYAGYETEQGIIGDPASVAFTKICMELGWKGEGTPFDPLPLVLQMGKQTPRILVIPREIVLEVPITHPELSIIDQLELKWYGVPIVSDMRLEMGGISYTAAPFNGWYMGTEIGARNFADTQRYNVLPKVAKLLGLDASREDTLWKDRALLEVNRAVLHSYKQQGVTIVDHHTASQQFKRFEEREEKSGREVTGNWSWLIPPMSPAVTHLFHSHYEDKLVLPNFFYQEKRTSLT